MELNLIQIFRNNYNWKPWYRLDKHIRNIKKFFKFCWQRITKGYCAYDLYNLDYYYLELFIVTLSEFRDISISYPGRYTPTEWKQILSKIIENFEKSKEDPQGNINEIDSVYENLKQGMKMLTENFYDLWD